MFNSLSKSIYAIYIQCLNEIIWYPYWFIAHILSIFHTAFSNEVLLGISFPTIFLSGLALQLHCQCDHHLLEFLHNVSYIYEVAGIYWKDLIVLWKAWWTSRPHFCILILRWRGIVLLGMKWLENSFIKCWRSPNVNEIGNIISKCFKTMILTREHFCVKAFVQVHHTEDISYMVDQVQLREWTLFLMLGKKRIFAHHIGFVLFDFTQNNSPGFDYLFLTNDSIRIEVNSMSRVLPTWI